MVKITKVCYLLFLVVTFSFSQENLLTSLTLPDHLTKNANAVLRYENLDVVINAVDNVTFTEKRIITVLNESGDYLVQASAGYSKHFKIKKIEAVVYNALGSEIKKFKKKDFIDHSAVDGFSIYTDSRVLFMGYTPTTYPYTVEFDLEIETSNSAGLPSWSPITNYYFAIEKSSYSLTDNANLGLRFKEKNINGFKIEKNTTTNTLNYTLSDMKALKPEDLSPSFENFTPHVLVAVDNFQYYGVLGTAKNWLEYGDWVNNALLKGRDAVTDETKQKILELTANISDPIEKAKKIFQFVQNNTRYISVQIGIGGMQPISALEVDQVKYGDCKGLTNYTKALLNIAGVESYYSIVQAGRDIVDFETDFASLAQGNHIILAIPKADNDLIWVDCTSQVHPFNFIGEFTDNRNVLMVKPNASEVVKTTMYPDSLNAQITNAEIKILNDGSMSSVLKRTTYGTQYDNRFTLERESDKDIKEYYKEHWDYVNSLDVEQYKFNNDKNRVVFEEDLKVSARNYAKITGDRLFMTINAFNKNTYVPKRYVSRKLPLEIQRGYLDEDSFVYQIPEGYKIEALPKNVTIKNKYGVYNVAVKFENSKIYYHRKLQINSGTYPKSEYDEYRDFRKQVAKNDNSKIVLKKSS
ncbi:DUF3857 domain-containing protein [Tamlana sp. 62-3]|uniref:DUF3857 domain-containing protein n=1 Tax=Neotamlana sargassicola TaxID=2883125 RepID=A0A9X1I4F3_9FLAO|nr:DUF3857 domain-containing protein [Tamlana sargassicola]MCB4806650.1 DUF3857 domain-containing protein [Tamlana sargassicola]